MSLLMSIAYARGEVCGFCNGMYLGMRDGETKTIRYETKYENGAHYIHYLKQKTYYVVCTKNSRGHKVTSTYWTDWELMGY